MEVFPCPLGILALVVLPDFWSVSNSQSVFPGLGGFACAVPPLVRLESFGSVGPCGPTPRGGNVRPPEGFHGGNASVPTVRTDRVPMSARGSTQDAQVPGFHVKFFTGMDLTSL